MDQDFRSLVAIVAEAERHLRQEFDPRKLEITAHRLQFIDPFHRLLPRLYDRIACVRKLEHALDQIGTLGSLRDSAAGASSRMQQVATPRRPYHRS